MHRNRRFLAHQKHEVFLSGPVGCSSSHFVRDFAHLVCKASLGAVPLECKKDQSFCTEGTTIPSCASAFPHNWWSVELYAKRDRCPVCAKGKTIPFCATSPRLGGKHCAFYRTGVKQIFKYCQPFLKPWRSFGRR